MSETGASVLLLEAGGDAPPESAVPGLDPIMVVSALNDAEWKYEAKKPKKDMLAYSNMVRIHCRTLK